MNGINKVMLVGFLGGNPEIQFTPSGNKVAHFTLATNSSWKDENGVKQERTEWHRCTAWNQKAEICAQILHTGNLVGIEGSLHHSEWTDKDGVKRYSTEVTVLDIKNFTPKKVEEVPTNQEILEKMKDLTKKTPAKKTK